MVDTGLVEDIAQSEPADFGILSPAASVSTDPNGHWSRGIDFQTINCSTHVRLSAICSSATGVDIVTRDPNAKLFRRYMPFDIEAQFECSTFAFEFLDYPAIAARQLDLVAAKAIERELWTGALSQQQVTAWDPSAHNGESFPNKWLASSEAIDVTPVPGTGVKPRFALAVLEDALGDCGIGIKGTIHMTRNVASALNFKTDGGKKVTSLNNTIIAGTGYTGSGPDGADRESNTLVWMYATGPVSVRLGAITATPDTMAQSVNTQINTVSVYASRPAAVAWDSCCHYGVLVDLAADYA